MNLGVIITGMVIQIAYLTLCYGDDPPPFEPMITIQYPAALLQYYTLVSKLPRNSNESPWNYQKTTLENLCIASVESRFFLFVEEKVKVSSPSHDRQTAWIKQWHRETKKQFTNVNLIDKESVLQMIPLLSVNIPEIAEVGKLEVMPCYIQNGAGWFVASLFNSGTYFSISKASAKAPYTLNGILEPIPIIDEELSNDQEKLEEAFHKGYTSKTGSKRTLLGLNPLGLMRVCSGIYVAWSKKKDSAVQASNTFRMPEATSSVWDAKIDLPHVVSNESFFARVHVKAHLITCTLNAEWQTPLFYVVADQDTKSGAYVIVENEKKTFSVFMHVTEIIALQQREE